MSIHQTKTTSKRKSSFISLDQRQPANPKTVLKDLFELLENYGPAWYTEDHHNRAVAALLDSAL
jgi:hypothetical protein